jgi:hypothetical protein
MADSLANLRPPARCGHADIHAHLSNDIRSDVCRFPHFLYVVGPIWSTFTFAAKTKDSVKTGDVSAVYAPSDADGSLLTHVEQCWPSARVITVASVTVAAQRVSATTDDVAAVAITTTGAAQAHGLQVLDATNALAASTWPKPRDWPRADKFLLRIQWRR